MWYFAWMNRSFELLPDVSVAPRSTESISGVVKSRGRQAGASKDVAKQPYHNLIICARKRDKTKGRMRVGESVALSLQCEN
jgi:hypothetical protein